MKDAEVGGKPSGINLLLLESRHETEKGDRKKNSRAAWQKLESIRQGRGRKWTSKKPGANKQCTRACWIDNSAENKSEYRFWLLPAKINP